VQPGIGGFLSTPGVLKQDYRGLKKLFFTYFRDSIKKSAYFRLSIFNALYNGVKLTIFYHGKDN
jgi:hypothetical protein